MTLPYEQPARPQPTREEETRARVARAAAAWRETRARVAGWPEDLARAELRACADRFGAEPGSGAGALDRQARTAIDACPTSNESDRRPVDSVTSGQAAVLVAAGGSSDRGEAARRAKARAR